MLGNIIFDSYFKARPKEIPSILITFKIDFIFFYFRVFESAGTAKVRYYLQIL